jgi:hypothetical protein
MANGKCQMTNGPCHSEGPSTISELNPLAFCHLAFGIWHLPFAIVTRQYEIRRPDGSGGGCPMRTRASAATAPCFRTITGLMSISSISGQASTS